MCLHCDAKTLVNKWSKMRNNYYLCFERVGIAYMRSIRHLRMCASRMRANNLSFRRRCDKEQIAPCWFGIASHTSHTHSRSQPPTGPIASKLHWWINLRMVCVVGFVCKCVRVVILRDLFLIIMITSLTRDVIHVLSNLWGVRMTKSMTRFACLFHLTKNKQKYPFFSLTNGMRFMTWWTHVIWGGGVCASSCVFPSGFSFGQESLTAATTTICHDFTTVITKIVFSFES